MSLYRSIITEVFTRCLRALNTFLKGDFVRAPVAKWSRELYALHKLITWFESQRCRQQFIVVLSTTEQFPFFQRETGSRRRLNTFAFSCRQFAPKTRFLVVDHI